MKKILVLLAMVFVTQGLLSQSTQYQYLNRLPEDSQIRRKCESWWKNKKACEQLEKDYEMYELNCTFFPSALEKESQKLEDKMESLIDEILYTEIHKNKKKEYELLLSLAKKIRHDIENYPLLYKSIESSGYAPQVM